MASDYKNLDDNTVTTPEEGISGTDIASADEDDQRQTHLVRQIDRAIDEMRHDDARDIVDNLHSADVADLMELLDRGDRKVLARVLNKGGIDHEVLSELEGQAFDDVISVLEPEEIADAVTKMETDDAVFVLEDMDAVEQKEVLGHMEADDRIALEEGLSYAEESAGRMMQRELIAVPPFWTLGQTLDHLRKHDDLPDDFWEIFVVDPHHRPIGTMPLSWAMRSKRPTKMSDLMKTEQTLIPVDMDQEEVAHRFQKYNLISAAVVDRDGRLVGVITVDDVVDVMGEEAEEDILALGGVSEGDVNISVMEIFKARFGWLFLNLITAVLASVVISLFDVTLEKLVALAILMPIVASMGGNAGTQAMTVAVRAIATKELTPANAMRVFGKEVTVAIMNGILFALVIGTIAHIWFNNIALGLVIGAAMVINLIVAGIAGILVPLTLDKLDIDPAVSSSVFVTTITDIIGFFAFLGLAAAYLL
jgi:magnesium transporter